MRQCLKFDDRVSDFVNVSIFEDRNVKKPLYHFINIVLSHNNQTIIISLPIDSLKPKKERKKTLKFFNITCIQSFSTLKATKVLKE
jgi:hypothetical protein